MTGKYIPDSLRLEVATRANYCCEYCRRSERDSFIKYQIDHIISRKHGGLTISINLAYACAICNGNKGSDIGTIVHDEDTFVRLFNPRKHNWFEHFEVIEGAFLPKSDIAAATIKVLDLNNINRILERLDLIEAGLFPFE
jgi:HNH endonuclease